MLKEKTITACNSWEDTVHGSQTAGASGQAVPSVPGYIDLVVLEDHLKKELTRGNQDRSHGRNLLPDPTTITNICPIPMFTLASASENLTLLDLKVLKVDVSMKFYCSGTEFVYCKLLALLKTIR